MRWPTVLWGFPSCTGPETLLGRSGHSAASSPPAPCMFGDALSGRHEESGLAGRVCGVRVHVHTRTIPAPSSHPHGTGRPDTHGSSPALVSIEQARKSGFCLHGALQIHEVVSFILKNGPRQACFFYSPELSLSGVVVHCREWLITYRRKEPWSVRCGQNGYGCPEHRGGGREWEEGGQPPLSAGVIAQNRSPRGF